MYLNLKKNANYKIKNDCIFCMQIRSVLFRLKCNTFANITLSGALMQRFAAVVNLVSYPTLFTVVDHNLQS